jgi:hypothetical protein
MDASRAGRRLESGLATMGKYLSKRGLGEDVDRRLPPIATTYWLTIAKPAVKKAIPKPIERELRTLVATIDALACGEVAEAADILMRRFQAAELALAHGWGAAQHVEALPELEVSALSENDRRKAAKREAKDVKTRLMLDQADKL